MTDSTRRSDIADDDLVAVGRVRRPTGIKGAVLVEVYSGDSNRFSVGDLVIADGVEHEIVEIGRSGNSAKLTFATIDSIEKADQFRGVELSVPSDALPENPPGVYYHYEVIGVDVETVDGQSLGKLTEILETGSNDVFVITPDSIAGSGKAQQILIPVLKGVIVEVDRESGTMTIDPPDGLL
jgi:16S rRNA processing protein RimM